LGKLVINQFSAFNKTTAILTSFTYQAKHAFYTVASASLQDLHGMLHLNSIIYSMLIFSIQCHSVYYCYNISF